MKEELKISFKLNKNQQENKEELFSILNQRRTKKRKVCVFRAPESRTLPFLYSRTVKTAWQQESSMNTPSLPTPTDEDFLKRCSFAMLDFSQQSEENSSALDAYPGSVLEHKPLPSFSHPFSLDSILSLFLCQLE